MDLVLPVRSNHAPASILAGIEQELLNEGYPLDPDMAKRVHVVPLESFRQLDQLEPVVRATGVGEIIHCAGCLDYFDSARLELVNVEYTRLLLEQSRLWAVRQFVYISTAFSSGYLETIVPEALHPEPEGDPTVYTRTKRAAERLVANSGLPFLCVRPAIIIGDSRYGHYLGKQYGLYQLWAGIERLLCTQWEPEFHVVAPPQPSYFVHQDAFQQAFLAGRRSLPPGTFFNIVSSPETAPNGRGLWNLWMDQCFEPRSVHYYDRVSDMPVHEMPRRQRALMALASTNLEIACHTWRFESTSLDALCEDGLNFQHATLETVARCQRRFMKASPRIQTFLNDIRPSPARGAKRLATRSSGSPMPHSPGGRALGSRSVAGGLRDWG